MDNSSNGPKFRAPDGSVHDVVCQIDRIIPFALDREDCRRAPVMSGPLMLCRHHMKWIGKQAGMMHPDEAEKVVRDRRSRERDDLRKTVEQLRSSIVRLKAKSDEPAKRETREAREDGSVYVVRVGAYYKIGWASDLGNRMRSYPPDTQLLAVMPGTRKDEARMHKKFAHLRTHGREWYPLAAQITEQIRIMVEQHGAPPATKFAAQPVTVPMPHRLNTVGPRTRAGWK